MIIVRKIEVTGVFIAPSVRIGTDINGVAVDVICHCRFILFGQSAPAVFDDQSAVGRRRAAFNYLTIHDAGEILLGIIIVISDDGNRVVGRSFTVIILRPVGGVHIPCVADLLVGFALIGKIAYRDAVTL